MKAFSFHISKLLKFNFIRSVRGANRTNRRIKNHYQGSSVRNTSVRDGYRLSPGEMSQLIVTLSRTERNVKRRRILAVVFLFAVMSIITFYVLVGLH